MYTVKLLQNSSSCTKKTMMKESGMKEEVVYFLMLQSVCVCVCVCEIYIYIYIYIYI